MVTEKDSAVKVSKKKRILAFFCKVCPFCVLARKWPGSRFAKFMGRFDKHCPFCRAYKEIFGPEQSDTQ